MQLTFALSDIHGMYDLLLDALCTIEEFCAERSGPPIPCRVVFLGDYVDRGPDSRKVLERLLQGPSYDWQQWVVLRGNHDDMMLKSLWGRNPKMEHLWLRNGGVQTLDNYTYQGEGVTDGPRLDRPTLDRHLQFISSMPLWFEDDRRIFVHAGVRPTRRMQYQDETDLMWIRLGEMDYLWRDSKCPPTKLIVHGHTPFHAGIPGKTVGVDGGACFPKGCLKVAVFEDHKREPVSMVEHRAGHPPYWTTLQNALTEELSI